MVLCVMGKIEQFVTREKTVTLVLCNAIERVVTFFFLFHASTFQLLLDKSWSQVSSLPPRGSCLQFYLHISSGTLPEGRILPTKGVAA